MLPGTVVKEMLAEKVEAIEFEQGRALKKKEKEALKEEIMHTLLPRAFSRTSQTFAWINPADNLMVVDAGSAKKADDLLALLRNHRLPAGSAGGPQEPARDHHDRVAQRGQPARRLHPGGRAELRSAMEHGGIIRCKQQDLMSEEIKNHLANDKLVTKLALNWGETLSFVLGDDLSIKRLKFSEELREQNDDVTSEDPAARLDADFALVTAELSQFIPALFAALGGEEQSI
jgi:recombination associated protein RdgC